MLKKLLLPIFISFMPIGLFFLWFFYPTIERGFLQMIDNTPPLPQEVTLHFGHQGVRDFYAYTHGKSDDYPDIMSFSSLRWQPPKLGSVTLSHFDSSVNIPHVFLVLGTRNAQRTDGIGVIDIDAGLHQAEFTTQEQAYQDYVALITAFKKAGWQHYFKPQDARIATEDNVKILLHYDPVDTPSDRYVMGSGYSSDSLTPLTFKEWRTVIEGQQFKFSLNLMLRLRDVVLWIKIDQSDAKPNPIPNQPDLEQYMVLLRFVTAKNEFFSTNRDGLDRAGLKAAYDEEREDGRIVRQREEEIAKKAGFSINESYQDPDMWQYIIEPAY